MEIWHYIKRAVAELTGHKFDPKAKTNIRNWQPAIVAIALLLGGVIFGLIVWSILPYGDTPTQSCVFRIPEADAPEPVTAGDAMQLDVCVSLEKAATPSSRTLGLSNRPSMPRERGMLFDFEIPGEYCMWMKDMNFSLDMIWLDEEQEIVDIKRDISPETYPKAFCGPETSRYVIEVNAGIAKAADLRVGQRLSF